jgi:hypothetical protein
MARISSCKRWHAVAFMFFLTAALILGAGCRDKDRHYIGGADTPLLLGFQSDSFSGDGKVDKTSKSSSALQPPSSGGGLLTVYERVIITVSGNQSVTVWGDDLVERPGFRTEFRILNTAGTAVEATVSATFNSESEAQVTFPAGLSVGAHEFLAVNRAPDGGELVSNPLTVVVVDENAITLTAINFPTCHRWIFPGQSGIRVEVEVTNTTGEKVDLIDGRINFSSGTTNLNPFLLAFWNQRVVTIAKGTNASPATGTMVFFVAATADLLPGLRVTTGCTLTSLGGDSGVSATHTSPATVTLGNQPTTGASPTISTKGGDMVSTGSGAGGAGGAINVDATGTFTLGTAQSVALSSPWTSTAGFSALTGTVTTNQSFPGGVRITGDVTLSGADTISATGIFVESGATLRTLNGGAVNLLSSGHIYVQGTILSRTKNAASALPGGAITFDATDSIGLDGALLDSSGGDSVGNSAAGGSGGAIQLRGAGPLTLVRATLRAKGGQAQNGSGGRGGGVALQAEGDTIRIDADSSIDTSGGNTFSQVGDNGGSAGRITLLAEKDPGPDRFDIWVFGTLRAEGGRSSGGSGGAGAQASLKGAHMLIGNSDGSPVLCTSGGSSSISGGWGSSGGNAGPISIQSIEGITIPEGGGLIAIGGAMDQGSGTDGRGGNIKLDAPQGPMRCDGTLDSRGGFSRGSGGGSPKAGSAGTIILQCGKNLTIGAKGLVSAQGGYPVSLTSQVEGGDASTIKLITYGISSATGPISIEGCVIASGGGGLSAKAGDATAIQIDGEGVQISGNVIAHGGDEIDKDDTDGGGGAIRITSQGTIEITGRLDSSSSDEDSTGRGAGLISLDVLSHGQSIRFTGNARVNANGHNRGPSAPGLRIRINEDVVNRSDILVGAGATLQSLDGKIVISTDATGDIDMDGTISADNGSVILQHLDTGTGSDGAIDIAGSIIAGSVDASQADDGNILVSGLIDSDGPVLLSTEDEGDIVVSGTVGGGNVEILVANGNGDISIMNTGGVTATLTAKLLISRTVNLSTGTITVDGSVASAGSNPSSDVEITARRGGITINGSVSAHDKVFIETDQSGAGVPDGPITVAGTVRGDADGGSAVGVAIKTQDFAHIQVSGSIISGADVEVFTDASGRDGTGVLTLSGSISAEGGVDLQSDTRIDHTGGTITAMKAIAGGPWVQYLAPTINLTGGSAVRANGKDATTSAGDGGNGGMILFSDASPGGVSFAVTLSGSGTLEARGGKGVDTNDGLPRVGGVGGSVVFGDANYQASRIDMGKAIDVSGGDSSGGPGGFGGGIFTVTGTGDVTITASLTLDGGDSTYDPGGFGGDAGILDLNLGGFLNIVSGTLSFKGGNGVAAGGYGGNADLGSGGTRIDTASGVTIDVSGGDGNPGPDGGPGKVQFDAATVNDNATIQPANATVVGN